MEETVKKRGRKKKEPQEVKPVVSEEPVKKKRGRKKKWETTTFKNNYINDNEEEDTSIFDEDEEIKDYSSSALSFGNLCIQVHDIEKGENTDISDFFTERDNKGCNIILSSDEEDTCDIVKENVKNVKHYNKGVDITKTKRCINDIRCYNCHHTFKNIPFYLPIDYCPKLQRYKLFGNFCSPNCAKSYCMNNKSFENKVYLIGQFYRKLFGPNFRITPAPSVLHLNTYGGKLSIEEFRKSFYTNSRYTINNINCKVVYIN